MKAAICTKYGPPEVLEIREVEKPTPKDDEVLVKILATTVSSGDMRIRSFYVPPLVWLPMRLAIGLLGPREKILGASLAGEIESVGKDVTRFKVGDQVFGCTKSGFGTHAQYVCVPGEDSTLLIKPPTMTHEDGAAIFFGGQTALHFLRRRNIEEGQKVLVYGASGAVGVFAVQLAKHFGAEVTGVCSGANLELVKSLGADKVVDYTKEDFSKNRERYDIVFDTVGKSPFAGCVKSLNKNGVYLRAVHIELLSILRGLWTGLTSGKKVIGGVAKGKIEDLTLLKELVEVGKIKPVIDRRYPLEQIAEAHRYVETGRKKGSVVVTVAHDS